LGYVLDVERTVADGAGWVCFKRRDEVA
jgi:hypothetical protein